MTNNEIDKGWAYHNYTKHSKLSIRNNPHYLDWLNQPLPYKIYTGLDPIPLPRESSSEMAALSAVSAVENRPVGEAVPDIKTMAAVLFLSAGITKRRNYPGGEIAFRAAACTGALYHIDLYTVCGDLPGLGAGVYHFGPHDLALRKLREGDYRGVLVRATSNEPSIAQAPALVVCASTYWRNAWKYRARAYRHCYWDNGTILANMLAAAAAHRLPARVVAGFVDSEVSRLIGLDTEREAALTIVALGSKSPDAGSSSPIAEPIAFETEPLSYREVDYPEIRAMHSASSLETEEEVSLWRGKQQAEGLPAHRLPEHDQRQPQLEIREDSTAKNNEPEVRRLFALQPLSDYEIPPDTTEEVILRRGSTREFSHQSIGFAELSTMLDRATRGVPFDFRNQSESPLTDLYIIVNAVDGLPSGAYFYRRENSALELLKEGDFRGKAGDLGLGQDIPADASADVFFLTDLNRVFERYGNRGYRAAQLEAGVIGGKLYLSAYALRLGASGLTFYDDDVTDFFSPHAAGKSVMFLMALGKSSRRRRLLSLAPES